ncbi:hypothetical protein EDB85DRAFT_2153920 [Lactarius pseudohatsudake]|nr:hypothetical protein EDB85DRAFT_2153920 [Lactarius pseudohatsudake]
MTEGQRPSPPAGQDMLQFDAGAFTLARTAEALAVDYADEVVPPDQIFILSPSSSALQAVKNPRSQSASKAALMFHQSLTTLVLRHPDLLLHLVWIPRDEELEGQNVAHLRAQEAARLDLPDQPHLRSAAFQKRRAREEAFHSWAFDWYLARVEGQWWELTRGLPPEGHAHTHVHLRPPDGNNHPLWSAAIDCTVSSALYEAPPPRPSNSRSTTRSPAPMLNVSDIMVIPPPSPVPVDGGFATLCNELFPTSKGAKRLMALIQLSHAGFQPEQGPLPANVVPPLDVPLEPD